MTNLNDWNQRKLNQSSQRLKDYQDLVYRKKAQGKGHRLLFAVGLALFLVFSSLKVNFQSSDGKNHFELHTQLVPLTQLVPCLVLIATALGVNTDPLAELLGRWVSKR